MNLTYIIANVLGSVRLNLVKETSIKPRCLRLSRLQKLKLGLFQTG
jgi:hypothetical protein